MSQRTLPFCTPQTGDGNAGRACNLAARIPDCGPKREALWPSLWATIPKLAPMRSAPMLAYSAPTTVEEAVRVLAGASGVAKVLSGGTDLLVQLRSGRAKPDLIVDIKNIADMSGIREQDGAFVIGAATPGAVIGECEALRQAWPGVVEASNLIGSTQIQGRATL